MAEEAVAYVSIVPVSRGAGKQIESQIDGTGVGASVGKQLGSGITGAIGSSIRGAATATVAAGAAAIGASLVKGFARLTAIDTATAKLKGLGNSAGDIAKIMTNATASVKGTAFGLDAAATVAAAAVASGIKPGTQLESVLKTIADTATIAGASMQDTGAIFNSVAARGKLQGDDLMQLQSRGVPVLQFLAKHYGITAQAASDMVSKGEVDFQNFAAAMQENLGGAALSSGDTFSGALANVGASLGRIGAGFLGGVFPKLAPAFQALTAALAPVESAAAKVGAAVGGFINPAIDRLVGLLQNGTNAFAGMGQILAPLGGALLALGAGGLAPLLAKLPLIGGLAGPIGALAGPIGIVTAALAGLVAASPDLRAALGGALSSIQPALVMLGSAVQGVLAEVIPVLSGLLSEVANVLANVVGALAPVVSQLIVVFAGLLPVITPIVTELGATLTGAIAALLPAILQLVAVFAPLIAQIASALLPALQLIVPVVLNLVMALVGALVPVINAVLTAIGPLITTIVGGLIPVLAQLITAIAPLVTEIGNVLIPIIEALLPVITTVFSAIVPIVQAALQIIQGIIQVVTGVISGNWAQVWAGIQNIVAGAWGVIRGVVLGAINIVRSVITAGLNAVRAVFSSAFSAAASAVSSNVNRISGFVRTMATAIGAGVSTAVSFFLSMPGRIVGALSGLGGQLVSVGQNLMQGFINGVTGFAGRMISAVTAPISGAINAAKGLLGIHSPSRVFRQIGDYVGQGLVQGLNGSSSGVLAAARKMSNTVGQAFESRQISESMAHNAYLAINAGTRQLEQAATQRASVAVRLKAANKALAAATKTRDDYRGNVLSNLTKFDTTAYRSPTSLISALTKRVADTKQFTSVMSQLRKMGLDSATYQQFIGAGVDALPQARNLLAGGASKVKQVASLQGQLSKASSTFATSAANDLYGAGVDAARGLVKGLQSQQNAIAAQMNKIASSMVGSIKKQLGIHSPSRVFDREVGQMVGAGLERGLYSKVGAVTDATAALVAIPTARAMRLDMSVPMMRTPRAVSAIDQLGSSAAGLQGSRTYNIYESTSAEATALAVERRERAQYT